MRNASMTVISTIASLLLLACDPALDIAGSVHDTSNSPIPSATVTLDCHDTSSHNGSILTDSLGNFQLRVGPGCLQRDCVVTIQKSGHQSKQRYVGDYCQKTHPACGSECNIVRVDVTLQKSQ